MTVVAAPARDRIVGVRIRGLRTAADVQLDCEPMTVLIGPNGVGKSTLIEGLEILRKIPQAREFMRALNDEHGGVSHLLRHGDTMLMLGVDISDGESRLSYELALARTDGGFVTEHESLHRGDEMLFSGDRDKYVFGQSLSSLPLSVVAVTRWPQLFALCAWSPTETWLATVVRVPSGSSCRGS